MAPNSPHSAPQRGQREQMTGAASRPVLLCGLCELSEARCRAHLLSRLRLHGSNIGVWDLLPMEGRRTRSRSELQSGQGSRSLYVRGDANLSPSFCIGCTSHLCLASVLNGVTAQEQMCR
jgi:hypothetical protein